MKYASWDEFMTAPATQAILRPIIDFVRAERIVGEVYPPVGSTFAFSKTPLRDVKVVILGQDPYHGPGQAHGLAFSYCGKGSLPPSLVNIFGELKADVPDAINDRIRRCITERREGLDGDLTPWTKQGVLLLNTALTVRQGEAGSHLAQWQLFTDEVVRAVVNSAEVAPHFILWGAKARATFERAIGKIRPISFGDGSTDHFDIHAFWGDARSITCTYSPHPSPLSADRGFFGSRPFSRANLALQLNNPGVAPVDWRLP